MRRAKPVGQRPRLRDLSRLAIADNTPFSASTIAGMT